ncbi:XRE family transcriptional regulator [Maribacter algicola]|uniref:XRE family transcriptional regulator n=1 Tax=Maribacter algicola TaxID=2498892 RepID=A0A426RGX6_9FLAO|nr:helix-turn-helix transcriptional regulator [Maribacter algicola]RRQ48166.1 XRE family transcriptional regulator [Maribacter algicola]
MPGLKEYRKNLNLTQEELSIKSGISLRTIQRVESGIDPKGYTLKALAKALEIDELGLLTNKPTNDRLNLELINYINLSTLIVVFLPIICFSVPLIITFTKKQFNKITKQIISIQMIWSLIMITIYLIGNIINLGALGRDVFIGFLYVLILLNIILVVRNSIELMRNKRLYIKLKSSII